MGTVFEGHSQTVLTVAVSADPAGRLVTGGESGELCVWSLDGAVIHRHVYEGDDDITSVVCSKQRPELIYISSGCCILGLDIRQLKDPAVTFSYNEEEINHLVLSEKEEYLAACDDSGSIKIINLFDKRVHKTLRKHENICAALSFHPKRPWDMFSGGYDNKLIQWDFSKGRSVCVINMEEIGTQNSPSNSYMINPPFIHSVALSQSGQYLACGTENADIQLFRTHKRTPEYLATLTGHTQGVSQVHFPDFMENHLISGGNDGQIYIWNLGEIPSGNPLTNGVNHAPSAAAEPAIAEQRERDSLKPNVTIDHGAKVNWLATGHRNNYKFIAVADSAEKLTLYPYPE